MKTALAFILFISMAPVCFAQTAAPSDLPLNGLNSISAGMVSFSDLRFMLTRIFDVIKTVFSWLLDLSRGWIRFDSSAIKPIDTGGVTVNNPADVVRQISDRSQGVKQQLSGVQSSTVDKIQTAKAGLNWAQSVLDEMLSVMNSAERLFYGILH